MKTSTTLFRCLSVILACGWLGLSPATATDVKSLLIAKGQAFQQTGTNAPVPTTPTPFKVVANINLNESGSVSSATLQPPTGALVTFSNDSNSLYIEGEFTNKSVLDFIAKPGTYQFTITTTHDGVQTPALIGGTDNYPATAPRVKNWPEAQAVDAAGLFTLRWDALTGTDTNDFVRLSIHEPGGDDVFHSPDVGEPNALNGLVSSWDIPAGTLEHGHTYEASLIIARYKTTNTTYVGVTGTTAFFKETGFSITTLPEPPAGGRLQFTTTAWSVGEAGGTVNLTVTRTGGSAGVVSVDYATVNGTATAGADFTGVATALSFAPGETNKDIVVTIHDDLLLESNETFRVILSNPQGDAILGTRTNAVVTIIDNELASAGTLQFSLGAYNVSEAGPTAPITVKRTGGTSSNVTVHFATSDGSAIAGTHYVAISSNLNFTPGLASTIVNVPVINNSTVNGNKFLNLALSSPSPGTSLGLFDTAVLTITENDVAGSVQFSLAAYSLSETGGLATITVTRTGGSASAVTVDFATSNLTATAGADYTATNGTLTFASNQLSATFQIQVIDDSLPEGNETVQLTLRNPGGGATLGAISNAVFTIIDDEITLQFVRTTFTNTEAGPTALLAVARTGPATATVSVQYATQNGTAFAGIDYLATNGTLSFGANVRTQSITIPIINDTAVEGAEIFFVNLSNPVGALLGSLSNATVNLLDNDLGGIIQFSTAGYTNSEAGPAASIIVTRTGGAASGVTVSFTTSNGTATAGADYTAVSSNLVFAANEVSKTVLVPIVNDSLDEPNETVQLFLSNPTGGASLGTKSNAVLTITDNDVAGSVQFSLAAYSLSETGGLATITVTRAGGSASAVTVDFATSNLTATAGADYTATNGTLTFASNQLSATFQIQVNDDGLPEGNETVQLTLRNPGGGATLGAISNAVFTIIDDEITLQFVRTTFTNSEAGPAALLAVARTGPGAGTVSVQYATQDGTAFAGIDYRATNGTLTFGPNVMTQNVAIAIINDTAVEGAEIFYVNLSSPVTALLGSLSNATVNLLDNDLGGIIQFSAAGYTNSEAGPAASIIVTRTGGAASGVTVSFTTSNGTATAGADYSAVSSNLVFAANEVSKTVLVPIVNDSLDEANETVQLFLSNPTGGASLGTKSNAVLTITDNDVAGSVQFSLAAYSLSETGGLATITVTRTGGSASAVTVDFATSNLTATAGADYTATNGTLTFASNQLSATFQIQVIDDANAEGNETVQLTLSNVTGGATLGTISNAVFTIIDNEITIQFARTAHTNSEAGPTVVLTVERTGPAAAAGSVQFTTFNGSAISPGDYKGTNGTLNFAANVLSQTITIPIVNDTIQEGDENFTVFLSNPSIGVLLGSRTNATVTIVDDDAAGVIQFSAAAYAVTEGTANATITVTRSNGLASGVTVSFTTSNGTATAGADYTAVTSNLVFNAGEVSKTILIPIATDVNNEPNETVNLILSNVTGGASLGTRSNATLTIANAPDPNAIPAAGNKFLSVTVTGIEGNTLSDTVNSTGGALDSLTLEYSPNYGGGSFHPLNAANNSLNGTTFTFKNLQFSYLLVTNTGVVTIFSNGSTGGAVLNKSVGTNPADSYIYGTGRTGGGGTVIIDVFDLANRVITGRIDMIMIESGGTKKVRVRGSFRMKAFTIDGM